MCGIAGYCGPNGRRNQLDQMSEALLRRGPDDSGLYEKENIGLAFRRLSIIDLKTGHQPLSNEDETVWVIFNGEIYDFQNTRETLIKSGHVFKTNSDTETIVHAYEEWGVDCFKKLNGMFAIALWDSKKQELILVRDRLGKKPLYWTLQDKTLWFASELKAMLNAKVFLKEIDLDSVGLYFREDYIPTPKTIFKDVWKLEPGTFLTFDAHGAITKNTFWDYPVLDIQEKTDTEITLELGKRIDTAVHERLISDVPLGLFLSGGLDSAVIAESASRQKTGLQAFSLGFENTSYDETKNSKIIAEKFGLEHHVKILKEEDLLQTLEDAINLLDEPLADPSILPQLLLSKFTRENVTVALSGDGGDELLLGYQHIPAHVWLERFSFIPTRILNIIADAFGKFHSSTDYFSFGFKAQRLSRGISIKDRMERDLAWRGSFDRKGVRRLLLPHVLEKINLNSAVEIMNRYAHKARKPESWSAWSFAYLRGFLMDDVMVKVDRATMWHSLEARAPLLDQKVVSYLLNTDDKYKLGNWKGKRLFKEILKNKLPDEIINSPKHGFGVPVAEWLNTSLYSKLLEVSEAEFLEKQNLFNREYILKIIDEHKNGVRDKRKELWAYLMFQLWYIKWI